MTTLSNTDRKSVVLSPSLCPSSLLRVTLIKRARQPKIAAPDSTMATIFFTVSVILLICSLKTRVYGETGKWFLCQHDRIRGFSLLGILRRWIAASLIKSLEISETAISRRVCGGSISSIRKIRCSLLKNVREPSGAERSGEGQSHFPQNSKCGKAHLNPQHQTWSSGSLLLLKPLSRNPKYAHYLSHSNTWDCHAEQWVYS